VFGSSCVKIKVEGSMKRKIVTLFKDLCCSVCNADFTEDSVQIMREENAQDEEMIVFKLACQECGKSFGVAFLGISDLELKDYSDDDVVLHMADGPSPISADEVLDAHKFIKKLDKNWQKFISDLDEN